MIMRWFGWFAVIRWTVIYHDEPIYTCNLHIIHVFSKILLKFDKLQQHSVKHPEFNREQERHLPFVRKCFETTD